MSERLLQILKLPTKMRNRELKMAGIDFEKIIYTHVIDDSEALFEVITDAGYTETFNELLREPLAQCTC